MNKCKIISAYRKGLQTRMGTIFFGTLLLFFVCYLGYLCYSNYALKESQTEIKEYYKEHICKADSLYCHLYEYNKNAFIEAQKMTDAILADSLINVALGKTQHLSQTQAKQLALIIETHFRKIEILHENYDEKLAKDSLRLATEHELLEGQTKNMIDLHLNKLVG